MSNLKLGKLSAIIFCFLCFALKAQAAILVVVEIERQIEKELSKQNLPEQRRQFLNDLLPEVKLLSEEWHSVYNMDPIEGIQTLKTLESEIIQLQQARAPQSDINKIYRRAFIVWNKCILHHYSVSASQKSTGAGGIGEGFFQIFKLIAGLGGAVGGAIGGGIWAYTTNDYTLAKFVLPPAILGYPFWKQIYKEIRVPQLNNAAQRKFESAVEPLLRQNPITVGFCEMRSLSRDLTTN